jgi:hypothetical protein
MKCKKLDKYHLLAAEVFSYSYDNYADHVEIENVRFTELMPDDVRILEQAEKENWSDKRLGQALELDDEQVKRLKKNYKIAKSIVFAKNPSESFRLAVKDSIKNAIELDKLTTEEDIDDLVIQICYRAADFGYLLALEDKELSDYSEWLRREKNCDYTGVGLPNLE